MGTFIRKKGYFSGKPVRTAILFLEILFILFVLVKSFSPQAVYEFGGENDDIAGTPEFFLNAGAYSITVTYDIGEAKTDLAGDATAEIAVCSLKSDRHQTAISDCSIVLDAGHNIATGYAWVKMANRVNDARIDIYSDTGNVVVHSIRFEEQLIYRVMRLLGWLILFVVIDAFAAVIFMDDIFRLSLDRKYLVLFLIGTCVAVNLPLTTGKLFEADDLPYHLYRIRCMADELRNGQFPVRIETEALNGYGYISSLMYGNIFLYIPAALVACMVPLANAYKIYMVLVNTATCLTAYYAVEKMTGKVRLAALGAFIYTFSAYRLVNVYVRGAVGEYTAMTFMPLVILGFCSILAGERRKYTLRDYAPLVIGLTGLIETHILSCEMWAIFILITCVVCIRRVLQPERFTALLRALIFTLLLNAVFLVPFIEFLGDNLAFNSYSVRNIGDQGIYLTQLFELFIYGAGTSIRDGMSDEFGVSIGASLTMALIMVLLYRVKHGKAANNSERICYSLMALGCLAAVMSLNIFPWDMVQNLSYGLAKLLGNVQFPWRYLSAATPLLLFGAMEMLGSLEAREGEGKVRTYSLILVCAAAIPAALFFADLTHQAGEYSYYNPGETGTFAVGAGEYMVSGETLDAVKYAECSTEDGVEILSYDKISGKVYLSCTNDSADIGVVTLPIAAYSHYEAIDEAGEEIALVNDGAWRLQLAIPAGYSGNICVQFAVPWYYRAAELVSLITLIGLIGRTVIYGHIIHRDAGVQ